MGRYFFKSVASIYIKSKCLLLILHRGPRPRNYHRLLSRFIVLYKLLLFFSILFKVLNKYDESLYKYSPSFMVIVERKYNQNILFYSESPQPPPTPPPPPPRRRRMCHAWYACYSTGQRDNDELQIENSQQNIAFSVNSILPLRSNIYIERKSLSLQQKSLNL